MLCKLATSSSVLKEKRTHTLILDGFKIKLCSGCKISWRVEKKSTIPFVEFQVWRYKSNLFGWGLKVYAQNQSGPSNSILHRFCLTGGSTLTSQDYNPSSMVYVSKPVRAIWRYFLSEFCALLCCSSSQWLVIYLWFL